MVEKGYEFGNKVQEGVDPRLDNRTGQDRPPVENDPAVPQQVDGPDLMHQEAHAEAVDRLAKEQESSRKGMFSPGDHSLGDEEARKGNDAGQADARLETDPGSKDSAPTDASKGDVGGAGRSATTASATERATAEPGEKRSVSTAGKDSTSGSTSSSSTSGKDK